VRERLHRCASAAVSAKPTTVHVIIKKTFRSQQEASLSNSKNMTSAALGLHARRDSLGGDDEEFDEADMWGGDEGPREEDDASRSSSDDEQEEQEAAAVAQEDGFSSAMR
jgi:hypothetical protein